MITDEERVVKAAQGFTVSFEFNGKKFWINPETWNDEKCKKLNSVTGLVGEFLGERFVVFDPEWYEIKKSPVEYLKIKKLDSKRLPQPLALDNYDRLFANCVLPSVLDLSDWDVSGIKSFNEMFTMTKNVIEINVNGWNMQKAETINSMFSYSKDLERIYMRDCVLPSCIVKSLFSCCEKLSTLDIWTGDRNLGLEAASNFYRCWELMRRAGLSGDLDRIDAGVLYDYVVNESKRRKTSCESRVVRSRSLSAWD